MRHRDWGLRPERIGHPCVLVHPPALAGYLRDLPLPPAVRTVVHEGTSPPAGSEAGAVLAVARRAVPDGPLYAATESFVCERLNFVFLYEGAVHAWLDTAAGEEICYRQNDGPYEPDLVGGCAVDSASLVDRRSTRTGDLALALLQADPRPKTLVLGDSHTLYLFTAADLIGARGIVVEAIAPRGRPELKVTHHLGPVTMHGLTSGAWLNAAFLREHGLSEGDRVVVVAGEIDVRNHIVRIARRDGISIDGVVRDLCARFVATLEAAARAFGPLGVVVAGPAPPLEVERIDGNEVAVFGTIAERVEATGLMRRELARHCARRGWDFLDVHPHYARPDGTLDVAQSDLFCHVSHHFKGPAVMALDALLAREDGSAGMSGPSRGAAAAAGLAP
ncbi:MAG: hypothetical protein AB7H88_11895 [Vicinamibacterales bacterium]